MTIQQLEYIVHDMKRKMKDESEIIPEEYLEYDFRKNIIKVEHDLCSPGYRRIPGNHQRYCKKTGKKYVCFIVFERGLTLCRIPIPGSAVPGKRPHWPDWWREASQSPSRSVRNCISYTTGKRSPRWRISS